MHESNLRFEHCYRLDMDARIAPSHREHCWRDWTEVYASDQSNDHIEYARRRIVALESGDRHLVTLNTDAPAENRVFEEADAPAPANAPMAAPAPTSAHEPPPKTEPVAPTPAPSVSAVPLPGRDCASQCEIPLGECNQLCKAKQADCATCREEYRRCMRRCYE
ncbi:MAG TPA: hypothetical protein VHE30_15805 [Polyangiaceae bacterium]|nr:hypothetical protein [Polyangiaceae bacterium]